MLLSKPLFARRPFSSRAAIAIQEGILTSLSSLTDPSTSKSLRSSGYLNITSADDGTDPAINLTLPSNFHPDRKVIIDSIKTTRPDLPLTVSFKNHLSLKSLSKQLGPGLEGVCAIVPIYSCKGGVGKSTVATNLAFALAREGGLKVGLLDCDVYGPSLPTLIKPSDKTVHRSELGPSMIKPIEVTLSDTPDPLKVMSLGFVAPEKRKPSSSSSDSSAAIIRGPMASRILTQLAKGTEWGSLDVLLLDLPPGTGDIQLTVCQELQCLAAVGVTTPGALSAVDVKKGIEMMEEMGVDTVVMVENMSHFTNPTTKEKHYLLGRSEGLREMVGSSGAVVSIPMSETISAANDEGRVVMQAHDYALEHALLPGGEEEAAAYSDLVSVVLAKLWEVTTRTSPTSSTSRKSTKINDGYEED
jgi:Mrp family chromosome partitioning ATPase